MKIDGSINTKCAIVPPQLSKHIFQTATCPLQEVEITAMQDALFQLLRYLPKRPLEPGAVCNVLYTTQDSLTLSLEDNQKEILGTSVHIAVLRLDQCRKLEQYNWRVLSLIFLEELCHSLYQEKNEYRVKYLVWDIAGNNLQIDLHEVYPDMFDEDDNPKFCPDLAHDFAELT